MPEYQKIHHTIHSRPYIPNIKYLSRIENFILHITSSSYIKKSYIREILYHIFSSHIKLYILYQRILHFIYLPHIINITLEIITYHIYIKSHILNGETLTSYILITQPKYCTGEKLHLTSESIILHFTIRKILHYIYF